MLRFRHNTIITVVIVGTLGLHVTAATELAQYKGLHYNVEERYVTDEDVKKAVEDKFSSTVKYERILDRKVAGFDRLDVDYDVYCDGDLLESNKNCGVTLGSEGLGKIFDKLIGSTPGDTVEIANTMPDDWEDSVIAGKAVLFNVTVNWICGDAIHQEYNDDWVRQYTEFRSTDEYENSVRSSIAKEYKEQFDKAVHDDLVSQIITNSVFDNDTVTDKEYADAVNNYKDYADAEGIEYNDFIYEYLGVTPDKAEETIREDILYNKKVDEAFSLIAKNEGLSISADAWEKYLESIALDYGYDDSADLENDVEDDDELKQSLEQECLNQIVYEFVLGSAVNDAKD